jgi:geranylgeranyl reductase family protein
MERAEVLIVGGGPSGSACAWALRRAGMDVAVLDQASFPRDKVCAGWITPAVLSSLEIDPGEYGREHVLQPIRGFRVGLMTGVDQPQSTVDIPYPDIVSYGIRRCEFDDYLLRRSGARLLTGEPVRSLRREGKEWRVDDRIRAPMLVGAGGHACPVARELGARPGGEQAVVAQEIEFLLPEGERAGCQVSGAQPELYFCADLAGYGWCFRKGDYLNIGLGRDDRQGLATHIEGFLAFMQRERGIPELPGRLHGHAYLLRGHSPRSVFADGVLLVGDAAGLAYPKSGEGIRPAVESGLLAASTIIEARGDYRGQRLAAYPERLSTRFGDGEGPADAFADLLPAGIRDLLARSLFSHPGLMRRLVLDRGFLHVKQPALAPVPVTTL